jgi:NAD(P)H-hydrate epimerase
MKSISAAQARAFDRLAQEKYGVPSIILMENAGRSVAEEALKMLGAQRRVVVVAGVGNNGGDGFVAARHLLNAGKEVALLIAGNRSRLKPDAALNLAILQKMPGYQDGADLAGADLIIDALFGVGLNAPAAGLARETIELILRSGKPVLAVDLPSGLNADTGEVMGAAVKALKTVTLIAVKRGMLIGAGPEHCGEIVVRDIGLTYNEADESV